IPTLASLLGLGTSLALWLLLIPPLGITGAGLGFAAGSVITGSIPAVCAARLIGTRRVRFLRLGAILAALVAVLLSLERVPLVAILVGDGLWLRDRGAMQPRDVGTAIVLVRSVTPPGVAGTSMRAVQAKTEVLSERVHDPGVLPRVAAQAHVALSQVQQVSTG